MDRIADYQLLRSLGRGNYGEFFLARRPARIPIEDEYVAVKVLAGATGDEAFRRSTRELRAFAAVRSPYLARLLDAGQEGASFFYAMEYFPRRSLADPSGPLTRGEILRAVAHGARAAHDLHEAGVVHRDIKPANILLTDDGAKLSDLGLAQFLAPGMTVTGMGPVTSIDFLDPGLVRGERASRASDVWSLGMTLHRALTGLGVYGGDLPEGDPILALRRVLTTVPQLADSLDPTERELIEACLKPDPAARPATAAAVADGIERLPVASP